MDWDEYSEFIKIESIKYITPQNNIEKFRFMYRYFLDKS